LILFLWLRAPFPWAPRPGKALSPFLFFLFDAGHRTRILRLLFLPTSLTQKNGQSPSFLPPAGEQGRKAETPPFLFRHFSPAGRQAFPLLFSLASPFSPLNSIEFTRTASLLLPPSQGWPSKSNTADPGSLPFNRKVFLPLLCAAGPDN